MRRIFVGPFLVMAIVVGATITSTLAGGAVSAAAGSAELDGILGFELGEERRYISGPPGAMRDDGEANWSIRLDQVVEREGRRVGVFTMNHEQHRRGLAFTGGIRVFWKYEGELLINEFGFPEGLRFTWFEQHTGESAFRGEPVYTSYLFEDGGFRKEVRLPDQEWEFDVPVARHKGLDLDVPQGLFLFRPIPAEIDYFTNPALLEFALPRLLEASWEQRTLFLKPTIPARFPGHGWIRAERDGRRNVDRQYDQITLEAAEETTLDIAGRTLNVRRLKISGPMRDAFVDEFGRIVWLDIEIDSQTRKDRHIRMLFPSEY